MRPRWALAVFQCSSAGWVDAALELAQRHVELGVTDDLGPLRLGAARPRGAVEEADVHVLPPLPACPPFVAAKRSSSVLMSGSWRL